MNKQERDGQTVKHSGSHCVDLTCCFVLKLVIFSLKQLCNRRTEQIGILLVSPISPGEISPLQ